MIEDGDRPAPAVYHSSRRKLWLLLAGSVAFVAAGAAFLVAHSTVKMTVAGAVAVPFFGACAVVLGRRLGSGRPELVIDAGGLEHVSLGRFEWTEIAAVRLRVQQVRTTSQRFVELVLHDPDAYLARAPRLVRATAGMNLGLGFGPANIPVNTLPVTPEVLLATMKQHRPELVVAP
ncbi:STM3941 family protein [Kitasatospora phosalacinea]|uniref:STM3941 family protein n=1 Tax=Kitasatospora phosalacinea TaxID=2065 RepID=UPI0025572873|nr:STM3941 family protein [Kitasatospora phosalacinea]